MLDTPCPYLCGQLTMPEPSGPAHHLAAVCPKCKRTGRAKITRVKGGPSVVSYSTQGRHKAAVTKDGRWDVRGNKERVARSGMSGQALFDLGLDTALGIVI